MKLHIVLILSSMLFFNRNYAS